MALTLAAVCQIQAQTTALTYQGRLNDGANPANGSYDLTFTLFGTNSGGGAVAGPQTNAATGVTNGLFTVTLDFGDQFPGADRWLEIGVRTNGGGAFATLSPRQPLTATPYAVRAANAGSAATANWVAATNISGTVEDARLSLNVALRNGGNTFTGNQLITNGNVGIGTATPATALTVATPVNSNGIEHTDGTRVLSTFLSSSGAWFGTVSPDPFYLYVNNGGPALTIGTNGNVSIGTPFPGASALQINQPFHLPLASGLQVNDAINGIDVQIDRGPGGGGIGLLVDNSGAGDASTSLLLMRNNVAAAPQTVLDVQADGKVGIQSGAPGKALQVGDPAVVGSEGMIRLSSRSVTGGAATRTWDIGVPQTGDNAAGVGYSFVINDVALASGTPQFLVQWGTGNVGIGTTNPAATLDVNGTVRATQFGGAGVLPWQVVSGTSQQAQPNTGYLATNNLLVTVTLPTNGNMGDIVRISGPGAGGWKVAQNVGQSVLGGNLSPGAGGVIWFPVGGDLPWAGIASSADGTQLVAVAFSGQVWISHNSGSTWSTATNLLGLLQCVACSADGTVIVAGINGGPIYTSIDSGVTWRTGNSGSRAWYSVACAGYGVPCAVVHGGQIYTSIDYGLTWVPHETNRLWYSVASSFNGDQLVAVVDGGQIYTSTDFGTNWVPRDSNRAWRSVASSSDGTHLVAAANGAQIYTSTDSGVTWTARDSTRNWIAVASSYDGTKLVAAVSGGQIYTSSDSGVTWAARDTARGWTSVASSSDGSRLAAAEKDGASTGSLYVSFPTITPSTTPGVAGYLLGSQNAAIELQYAGNGQFLPLSYVGTVSPY